VSPAFLLADVASELALFAAVGFLLFAIDDPAVDLIYFTRRAWRWLTVYSRHPRAYARSILMLWKPRFIAVFRACGAASSPASIGSTPGRASA
jgi:adsorption protein B